MYFKEIHNYDEAIKYFNETIKLNENHSKAYASKGECLLEQKEYEKAIENFDICIQIDPLSSELCQPFKENAIKNKSNNFYCIILFYIIINNEKLKV